MKIRCVDYIPIHIRDNIPIHLSGQLFQYHEFCAKRYNIFLTMTFPGIIMRFVYIDKLLSRQSIIKWQELSADGQYLSLELTDGQFIPRGVTMDSSFLEYYKVRSIICILNIRKKITDKQNNMSRTQIRKRKKDDPRIILNKCYKNKFVELSNLPLY